MINKTKISIVVIMLIFFLNINIVSANSITLVDNYNANYFNVAGGGPHNYNATFFVVQNQTYNLISKITLSIDAPNYGVIFAYPSNSTTFICVGNATCTGTVTYNNVNKNITWYFDGAGANVFGKYMRLSYDDGYNFWRQLSAGGVPGKVYQGDNGAPSNSNPVFSCTNDIAVLCSASSTVRGHYYVEYGTSVQNTYSLSYSSPNLYFLNVVKGTGINTRWRLYDTNNNTYPGAFFVLDDLGFNYGTEYGQGLYANFSITSGRHSIIILNSTNIIPISNEQYNITFNKSFYNLGEQTNISYTIPELDLTNKFYRIKVFNANDMINAEYTSQNIISTTGFVIPTIIDKTIPTAFYAKLYSYEYSDAYTYFANKILLADTFVSYGVNISNIFGNISTDKLSYNTTETVKIKYNTTTSGRIRVKDGLNNYWFLPIIAGNNQQMSFYISSSDNIGTWQLLLQNYLGTWDTINSTTFTVNAHDSRVDFDKTTYLLGETITITSWGNTTGYISLFDSNNLLISNFTTTSGSVNVNSYYLSSIATIGTYTVNLYNNTGVLVATDSTYVNDAVITPTSTIPKITPTVTVSSLLDLGSIVSEAVIGKQTDENGIVTDVQIKKTGNQLYGIMLMVVLVCLIATTYYTITNQRRK